MTVRAYLRASTNGQDANRARQSLADFADLNNIVIAKYYTEHASGARLDRPKLNELLEDCDVGDIILIESIDRLTRLKESDWQALKHQIRQLGVRIIALDLPTTHQAISPTDDLTRGILTAVNEMMIDVLAIIARKDYEQRRQRQSQGIAKAKAQGKYKGRKANTKKYQQINTLLAGGLSHREISKALGCSPSTIARAKRWDG